MSSKLDTVSNIDVIAVPEGSPMSASFEEKSVWIQLAAMVIVLACYVYVSAGMIAQGVRVFTPFFAVFMTAAAAMVVILVAGHIVAAITGPTEAADERDRLIGWRSESNASWILGAGAFMAITGMGLGFESVWTANLLVVSMFLSEIVKHVLQLVYYRRGL